MGRFNEILSKAGTPGDEHLPEVWLEHFPLLTEAFFPPPGKASGTFASPKFSLTAFSEGHRLKGVLGSKFHPKKLWCTLDGPEGLLEQMELLLRTGGGEWRDAKEQD